MKAPLGFFEGQVTTWQEMMAVIVATMREISRHTDPQEMHKAYRKRMSRLFPTDCFMALSRRDLKAPYFRITRSSQWKQEINPWKDKDLLPLLKGGFLAELVYGDEPRFFDDLHLDPDDPAYPYLGEQRSLLAVPIFDQGVALNWAIMARKEPDAFDREQFPDVVWTSNLFGRATHNLVLSERLKSAYEQVDYEMKVVADIQRSLLPSQMPTIPTMALAAHYQTSHRAGGDYYDFFPLSGGKWGLLIADVSGHGTPAAVIMAVTHTLAHTFPGAPEPPGQLLTHVNHQLCSLYTAHSDTFVTAFYGVYDPSNRTLTYASAGHNPPRLKRCEDGSLALLDAARGLPLGIFPAETYRDATHTLVPGDQLVLYTDGITEADNEAGELFGLERMDKVLENCSINVSDLLKAVLAAVDEFTGGRPAADDRTLLVAKIS